MMNATRFFIPLLLVSFQISPIFAQDEGAATERAEVSLDDLRSIIVLPGANKKPAFLYAARAEAQVQIASEKVSQELKISVRVVQGTGSRISLQLNGPGAVMAVAGEEITSWSVRRSGDERFLELELRESDQENREVTASVTIESIVNTVPSEVELAHLGPGGALGFDSKITINYAENMAGKILAAEGFSPLESQGRSDRLQSSTGGRLLLKLERLSALPPDIELRNAKLVGQLHANGRSVRFRLEGTLAVTQRASRLRLFAGSIALDALPSSDHYSLELKRDEQSAYYEAFAPEKGEFPLDIQFVVPIGTPRSDWYSLEFTIASSAVVPFQLKDFPKDLQFARKSQWMVPTLIEKQWQGFLPASGHVRMEWSKAKESAESKLFFTTSTRVEANVGPGLLRELHTIDYQLLQGQLKSLELEIRGPGEILDVEGQNLVGWKVVDDGNARRLDITLGQPLTDNTQIRVRSQTPLDAFPVQIEGMRLEPKGAIRHSGYLRIANSGSVSIEPTDLQGLSQLAPNQFPGEAVEARQQFAFRFPSGDYRFTIVADRIQPEVSVTELVLYQLSESDRIVTADIELDIREAAIREWDLSLPEDYSIVALTGASVADYVAASEAEAGLRNVKVLFSQDIQGRQLVNLRLEKNEPATAGTWDLPRLEFPGAKSVRGDLGVVAAPGYRIAVSSSEMLVEKPLSYFPRPVPNLQQAYRIREPEWSATLQVEELERNIQSDVFHLYSLSQGTVYGSALVNYFITGAPTAELQLTVPTQLGNVAIEGQDIRTWRREGDTLTVALHQAVMGGYTLLITFEEKPSEVNGAFEAGTVAPVGVQGDRGYIEVVSPVQVELDTLVASAELLELDALELPAEFRLLSTAPALGTWQYTERPFALQLAVDWFEPGTTATQVVEFSEANSRVSPDGELVTDIVYYVKSRGQNSLRLQLPEDPVRLWSVSVNGQPVTAREAGDETWIPLPGGADPNAPIEVNLRLGKPATQAHHAELVLPTVFAPVLKTQWNLKGDENHVLVPTSGELRPATPVPWPTGFEWLATQGFWTLVLTSLLVVVGTLATRTNNGLLRFVGLIILIGAVLVAGRAAWTSSAVAGKSQPLNLSLPVIAAGERIQLSVANQPLWLAALSWTGLGLIAGGLLLLLASRLSRLGRGQLPSRWLGVAFLLVGILLHANGGPWFFGALALGVLAFQIIPGLSHMLNFARSRRNQGVQADGSSPTSAVVTTSLLLLVSTAGLLAPKSLAAAEKSLRSAQALTQQWEVSGKASRLNATGKIDVAGEPGDQFLLLRAPAILTEFQGKGLRLSKITLPELGLAYVITIPLDESLEPEAAENGDSGEDVNPEPNPAAQETHKYSATFKYQVDAVEPIQGLSVLTGSAALQSVVLQFDEANREVQCEAAVRIEVDEAANGTNATILLGPNPATIVLRPKSRDLAAEDTQFFVEAAQAYTPGPGVVDGRHRFGLRTAQGRMQTLTIHIPDGLTVSSVDGPVNTWQFDADQRRLQIELASDAKPNFVIDVETQRGLDPLPSEIELSPLRVADAEGEVGLLAVAFGPDAQPADVEAEGMSLVNLGDFDARQLEGTGAALHRVYRYATEPCHLHVQVVTVSPEVRLLSRQVLSFGDERIVLAVNFSAEITRTGLFQLSFPLPQNFEVESLSGDALHHWSELGEEGNRKIVLHLKDKTLGLQKFSLTLAGNAPEDVTEWQVPRFSLDDATRQSGDLVIQPTTGIRLRTITRQNVSETDPRALGGQSQGALAFRLLQDDWNLTIGIEKLDPWITGQVLHEVVLREGQTRSTLYSDFRVENASIRSLQVVLPINDSDVVKTLRANGNAISDFVKVEGTPNTWELQFKRRVIGRIQFHIEYERRGERTNSGESLTPFSFPDARQLSYFYAVRTSGRLEAEFNDLPAGWQRHDWNSVPQPLRESGNRDAPALTLRVLSPSNSLALRVIRHALADALKLRVASSTIDTILSPTGDQLTAVEISMQVIQRSSLTVQLPPGSELFNIFVNGESVHSIRQTDSSDTWQFYVLPGIDEQTAQVQFAYSLTGGDISQLSLTSPQLNVPLENVEWNVIAPEGFQLIDEEGNLELVGQGNRDSYDRESYLLSVKESAQAQAQKATQLLEKANIYLQAGQQEKASWALNNVANSYSLDAASNEDARVQLENLQTQQAIVGLNTRRQRLYLYNDPGNELLPGNDQFLQAASNNPVLQQEQLNFRPQELSQLLAGNSTEDNTVLQRIASRLVQHQRTIDPAPQAIVISLPEEGNVYRFTRPVQVAEFAPLELELAFKSQFRLLPWQWLLIGSILLVTAFCLASPFADLHSKVRPPSNA